MESLELNQFWEQIKGELIKALPENALPWVYPLEISGYDKGVVTVVTGQLMGRDLLRKNHYRQIVEVLKQVTGDEKSDIVIIYDATAAKTLKRENEKLQKKVATAVMKEQAMENLSYMQSASNLNLKYKFENYVVGESNQHAFKIAKVVAEAPAQKFNPLFIYGNSGLGKTHLMQAIGHYVIFNKPELKVRYIRMEDYFNEWMKCFQYNEAPNGKKNVGCNNALMRKFHQKFQNVDILLMDDIQFIESKMKTMEDFFSTFEALYTNNKQIVIASDRLPADIPKLDNRLRTRFEMGLVVDMLPPAYETRVEIVRSYAKELKVEADDDVFEYIADNFVNNVRELKGAFNKVSAYAEFSGLGVTLDVAQKALNCAVRKKDLTVDKIAQTVADYYELTVKDLKSTARQQKIAHARHLAVYMAREVLQMSYEAIGEFFDKKHTTIMYSCETVAEKVKIDSELKSVIEELKSSLRG